MSSKGSLTSLKLLMFNFHAANTIILSFLPLYLKYKGLSGTEIGWVLAIGPFASIISQPFWGYLSDKYKTIKKMLLLSIAGMLTMSIIFFQMNELVAIIVVGAFFYFFSSPVGALGDSLAQRRANDLNISFGSIRMWGSIGFAFSSLIVGELLTKFGVAFIVWPYILLSITLFFVALSIKDVTVNETPVQLKDLRLLLQNKAFILFLIAMMCMTITHRANDSYIGIYINELGGTEALVGVAWFVGLISEATVFALSAYWFRKFHPIFFIILASIIYASRWFIYGVVAGPQAIIALQFMHGLTFGVFYTTAFDYVTKIIPDFLQSTGHLVFFSVFFGVSGIIGSLGGGWIMEHYNGTTLYNLMGVTALIGAIMMTIYYMNRRKIEL